MPLQSQPSASRRPHRKLVNDDETDLRRARGEISCAECRRLKLKCDKKLPCGSCIRRGCPSICPNGSLSTGQGTRFVLADTTQLHAKVSEMGQRIRQLEDALAIFQSSISNETHPLLRDELMNIKFGPENGQNSPKKSTIDDTLSEPIDALGTLTIDEGGQAKYFGRSAGSEALFLAGAEMENMTCPGEANEIPQISIEIARLSNAFPFGVEGTPARAMDLLLNHLPTQPRAWSLCETYMEHASWAFRPMKRDEIVDDILAPIYKYTRDRDAGLEVSPTFSYHKLAVLFLVFAIGALVDLTLEPYNAESDVYYQVGRACLSMRSVFDSPDMATIQAVALMGSYHGLGGKSFTLDSTWSLTSLACKLAQGHGLHRESSRFDLDNKIVQRRRALFWELLCSEHFYSVATGRPPCIRLSYIDCEFPEDDLASLDHDGNILKGYYQWKFEFVKEIFAPITESTLKAETCNYPEILELDRKVREKPLPPHLNIFMNIEDENCTPSAYMRGCLLGQFRAVTLLYIHRSFFAQAMLDHPANPLRSPYAPSFLAAYRCASGIIKANINHFDRFPELCCRWWTIWTHLFSAAVIVGTIVTRSPSSSMAPSAFIELGIACDLFEKGAPHSHRARSGWAILCKLREKAFQVYSQFRSGIPSSNSVLSVAKPDYGDDELALFGGQTRVLVSKLLKKTGQKQRKEAASPPKHDAPSPEATTPPSDLPDVHPSLVEYLSGIPIGSGQTVTSIRPPVHSSGFVQSNSFQYLPSESQGVSSSVWRSSGTSSNPTTSALVQALDNYPKYLSSTTSQSSFYAPTTTTPYSDNYSMETSPPQSLSDVGLMMTTGDPGMDEQWMSFMKDSGLLNETADSSQLGLYAFQSNGA